MNEPRQAAYEDFIYEVLEVLRISETELFTLMQLHADLLDAGLVEVIDQTLEQLNAGLNYTAMQRLKMLRQQVMQQITSNPSDLPGASLHFDSVAQRRIEDQPAVEAARGFFNTALNAVVYAMTQQHEGQLDVEAARWFLDTLLEEVRHYGYQPEHIYPRWRHQVQRFDEALLQAIPLEASVRLAGDISVVIDEALLFFQLGLLIEDFPYGNKAIKLEQAISVYHAVLTVIPSIQFPIEWAAITSKLAFAYTERRRGEQSDDIEQAIVLFQQALQVFIPEQFPIEWAATTNNLALAYTKRIRGERADNIEQAINLYQQALQICTQEQFPVEWATTTNNLAFTYTKRIQGGRADNIEQAIDLFQQALRVRTREQFPIDWANTTSNLASAYENRIRGERADNIEQAIHLYQQALQVHTREQFPIDWANTTSNLASAYKNRIRGERADNIEQAINLHQQALQVHTREQFPIDWAATTTNLASVYKNRIRGERADNIEQTIVLCEQVLRVYTQEQFPADWATTINNLALAYENRIRGERADNIEQAINLYQQALQVRTREQFPIDWAQTINNLASAYKNRIRGERADNIEQAIHLYQQALQVRTREQFPIDWANTTSNLASAYENRIRGERADSIEQAIHLYQQALQVRTREQLPLEWAATTNNLALAYKNRIRGERADSIEQAIHLYQQALQVCTPAGLPLGCYQLGFNLGNLGFLERNWHLAIEGYSHAIAAIERSRSWATTETSRQEIQAGAATVYSQMVAACVNAGDLGLAQETVERSRSRRIVEMMAINEFYDNTDIPPQMQASLTAYETLQRRIDELRLRLVQRRDQEAVDTVQAVRGGDALEAASDQIAALEQEKQALRQQISRLDPVTAGQLEVSPPALAGMQQLIDEPTTALLSFYTTGENTYIFVLRQNQVACHTVLGQERHLQAFLLDQWLRPYLDSHELWKVHIPAVLQELSERLKLEALIQTHLQGIEELILIPHFYLHQIPYAALPTSQGLLGDRFRLRVVPNCQVLQFCHQRPPIDPSTMGIVEDASEDLPCAVFEAKAIAKLNTVPAELRLRGYQEATVDGYKQLLEEHQVQYLLSSHHAQSRLDNPLQSELTLADGRITLGELLSPAWRLPALRDVFLSCCETGLGQFSDLTDDIVTLATGFLCAGASSVVSTLWSVDDLATAIFSILYHEHLNHQQQQGQMNRPLALQLAQQTLRTMTGIQLRQTYYDDLANVLDARQVEVKERRRRATSPEEDKFWGNVLTKISQASCFLDKHCTKSYPFEHPFYWAGFVCYGLR